jgi:hypothetical protein
MIHPIPNAAELDAKKHQLFEPLARLGLYANQI